MMTAKLACLAVAIEPRGREDSLPHPFTSRVRILPREGRRELDPPGSRLNVTTMLHAHRLEMPREIVLDHRRQNSHAILVTLRRTTMWFAPKSTS